MNDIALQIFRHKKLGDYVIQRYLGSNGVGGFIKFSSTAMQEWAAELVLTHFKIAIPSNTERPGLANLAGDEEKEFYRKHSAVMVRFVDSKTLKLAPLQRKGSGFVAPKDEVIELSLPSTKEEFLSALDRAFQAAC